MAGKIDTSKLAPCGYCRRCAIHDDPGGCLEVEAYERELIAQGFTLADMQAAVRGEAVEAPKPVAPHIAEIAKRRVDALLEAPHEPFHEMDAAYARRDQLRSALETRGTSAVALEELRLLEEALMQYEHDMFQQQQAEIDAENAWLREAEAPTADDIMFEQYEHDMGCWS